MATQQNASSSEELAATAEELSGQAEQLQLTMSFFRLSRDGAGSARSKPAKAAKPVRRAQAAKSAPTRFGSGLTLAPAAAGAPDEADFTKF